MGERTSRLHCGETSFKKNIGNCVRREKQTRHQNSHSVAKGKKKVAHILTERSAKIQRTGRAALKRECGINSRRKEYKRAISADVNHRDSPARARTERCGELTKNLANEGSESIRATYKTGKKRGHTLSPETMIPLARVRLEGKGSVAREKLKTWSMRRADEECLLPAHAGRTNGRPRRWLAVVRGRGRARAPGSKIEREGGKGPMPRPRKYKEEKGLRQGCVLPQQDLSHHEKKT